jgi:hypothetical protein
MFRRFSLFCALSIVASAAELPSTSVIRRAVDLDEGPLEALTQDSIVPVWHATTEAATARPGLQRTLVQKIPLSMTDQGSPGSLSQIRGMGISAEDTNVQAFGIPLNYAQGGGFDFSVFPAYLWTDLRWRLGGNPLSLDPRGVSGTLSLTPWSARALHEAQPRTEVGGQYSGRRTANDKISN